MLVILGAAILGIFALILAIGVGQADVDTRRRPF